MANTKSAEKRIKQAEKRRERNRYHRSRMRTAVKRLRTLITEGNGQGAREALNGTLGLIDATAQKGVIHRNAAARTKSRLSLAVNKLG
jgi:small subunit ribosomal protein S20